MAQYLLLVRWKVDVLAWVDFQIRLSLIVRQRIDVLCTVVHGGEKLIEIRRFGRVELYSNVCKKRLCIALLYRIIPACVSLQPKATYSR